MSLPKYNKSSIIIPYEDAQEQLDKFPLQESSHFMENLKIDEFHCKTCRNNQWEISAVGQLDDGIWKYQLSIDKLWCLKCKKECKRNDVYTKQEQRHEKLVFLIDKL
jgi:hypothetical protein